MQGSGIFQMKTVFHSYSSKQTEEFGSQLGKSLKAGDVVALFGDLGAGKTAFTRGLAHGMGFDGEVSSPTFALVHEYPADIPIIILTCTGLLPGTIFIQPDFSIISIWAACS